MPRTRRAASSARTYFGTRARAVRHAKGLTLEEVAERSDLAWSYIASVERGERNISIDNMAALAEALGVPLKELLPEA